MYHQAFETAEFQAVIKQLLEFGARQVQSPVMSSHFRRQVCFLMLPGMNLFEFIDNGS
jgi:hypothetical protein